MSKKTVRSLQMELAEMHAENTALKQQVHTLLGTMLNAAKFQDEEIARTRSLVENLSEENFLLRKMLLIHQDPNVEDRELDQKAVLPVEVAE